MYCLYSCNEAGIITHGISWQKDKHFERRYPGRCRLSHNSPELGHILLLFVLKKRDALQSARRIKLYDS